MASELNSNLVISRLEEHKGDLHLYDDGHYFELVGNISGDLDDILCICAKTYTDNGLCFITVYFEGVFYCILSHINEDEPLLDIEFPDVSQEGDGITLGIYDEKEDDTAAIQWRKLSLWQSISSSQSISDSSVLVPPKISLPANEYIQTYCVLKPNKLDQSNRDVLFRFGSWFYAGNVELIESLCVDDIPHVIPALRIQQHKLAYLCDVSSIPEDNLFTEPILYNDQIINVLESEILAAESTIDKMRQNPSCSWLEEDPSKIFFEFTCSAKNNPILSRNHIDLIATKSYRPNGIVVMTIYFDGTFYVCLCNGDGDQSLLDSDFPCIIQGKGYQLKTYPNGLNSFPELRKLSIWQNAQAIENKIFEDSPEKQERENNSVDKPDQYRELEMETSSSKAPLFERSSEDANAMPRSKTKSDYIKDVPNHKMKSTDRSKELGDNATRPKTKRFTEEKHSDEPRAEERPSIDAKLTNHRKKNLGAFHHLAPLLKKSNLQEQMKKIDTRKGHERVERAPFRRDGQPY